MDSGFGTPPGPALSNSAPLVSGTASAGTALTASRADHAHPTSAVTPFAVGAPNSRSLSLATAYQATDNTKPAMVTVNLTSTANFSLSGGTTNSADVVIGSTNAVAVGTGTVVGKYSNSVTGTIAVGLNLNSVAANTYILVLPAGWFFAVRTTAGSVTVTSAFDQSAG